MQKDQILMKAREISSEVRVSAISESLPSPSFGSKVST